LRDASCRNPSTDRTGQPLSLRTRAMLKLAPTGMGEDARSW
jgi:hypothetical protein